MNVFVIEVRDERDFSVEHIAVSENELSLEDVEGFVLLSKEAKARLGIPVEKSALVMTKEEFIADNKETIVKDLNGAKWRYNHQCHCWEMIDE